MPTLTFRLFGPLRVSSADGDAVAFPSRKAAALLAYVASQPDRTHSRTGLAQLFWPELPERSAQNNLRVTLSRLNALTGNGPLFESAAGTVGLARERTLRTDVADFERLLAGSTSHEHDHRANCAECRRTLLEIDATYRGPFLEGLELPACHAFEAWHAETADRFRLAAIGVLHDLAHGSEGHDDLASAEFHARRLLALDPLHDGGSLSLMRAVNGQGRRNEAIAHFHRYAATLKAELDVEPDEATIGFFHEIQGPPRPAPRHAPLTFDRHPRRPRGARSVIGRETELLRVGDLLHERPLITLHGIGGAGKTTMAVELARRLAGRYGDGVVEVRLSDVIEAADVPTIIAQALGTSPPAGRDALAHLLDHLSSRKTLLVLDGFEHLLDARSSLGAIVDAAPDVRILVTSREPLGLPQETAIPVSGLDYPSRDPVAPTLAELAATSAGELFIDTARRVRSEFDPTPE